MSGRSDSRSAKKSVTAPDRSLTKLSSASLSSATWLAMASQAIAAKAGSRITLTDRTAAGGALPMQIQLGHKEVRDPAKERHHPIGVVKPQTAHR